MIKVILADDHKIVRDGIKALLKEDPGIYLMAEASNGRELLALLHKEKADVVLLDINMPGMDGFEITRIIAAQYPAVRILVLSMLENEQDILNVLQNGATGYILKNTDKEELIYAIQTVATGHSYIFPEISMNLLKKSKKSGQQANLNESTTTQTASQQKQIIGTAKEVLSKRELEVLKLIAEGLTNAEIAERLFTSKRTIDGHRQNLIEKTHAKNTAALIKYAVSKGIVT